VCPVLGKSPVLPHVIPKFKKTVIPMGLPFSEINSEIKKPEHLVGLKLGMTVSLLTNPLIDLVKAGVVNRQPQMSMLVSKCE